MKGRAALFSTLDGRGESTVGEFVIAPPETAPAQLRAVLGFGIDGGGCDSPDEPEDDDAEEPDPSTGLSRLSRS